MTTVRMWAWIQVAVALVAVAQLRHRGGGAS